MNDPEGTWLVKIRDWNIPSQWNTREVTVERFPSGSLEIVEDGKLRHGSDVRKWIRKVKELER